MQRLYKFYESIVKIKKIKFNNSVKNTFNLIKLHLILKIDKDI